jgi:gluconate kinase
MASRQGHFMPPALLDSQFADLQEPGADENPIIVPIGGTRQDAVDDALRQLQARITGESSA